MAAAAWSGATDHASASMRPVDQRGEARRSPGAEVRLAEHAGQQRHWSRPPRRSGPARAAARPPGRPPAEQLAGAAVAGARRRPRSRPGRPRRPDRRTSRRRAAVRASASTSANTLPAAAPAAFGPAGAAAAAASAAAFLAQPASSTPVTSVAALDVEARRGERVAELAAKAPRRRGNHERSAVVEHVGGVRRAAERRHARRAHALGDVGRGQRAERRDEALGHHEHAGAGGIAPPCAATAAGSARAGTAKQTRSWAPSSTSRAHGHLTRSGSSTPGR